jgi:ribonuclease D
MSFTSPKSLLALTAIFLGFRLDKKVRKTNWASANLTDRQILYAATDAWASLKVYEKMLEISNKEAEVSS